MSLTTMGCSGTEALPINPLYLSPSLWFDANTTSTHIAKSARSLTAASSQYFTKTSSLGGLDPNGSNFTVGGWYFRTSSGSMQLIDCRDAGNANAGFSLATASDLIRFTVGGTATVASGGLSLNGWSYASGKWNGTNALRAIGAGAYGQSIAASWVGGTLTFSLGRYVQNTAFMNGRMGPQYMYSRALTNGESQALYAAGAGISYDSLSAGQLSGLVAWWEMNEASGDAIDRVSGITLTATNTPVAADGPFDTSARDNTIIRQWSDTSGNALHASQTTTHNKRPIYDDDAPKNMTFDGSNDQLVATITWGSAYTTFVVAKATSAGVTDPICGSDARGAISINSSNDLSVRVSGSGGNVTVTKTPSSVTSTQIYSMRTDGTSVWCGVNGAESAPGAILGTINTGSTNFNVGCIAASPITTFGGKIYEIVHVPTCLSVGQFNIEVARLKLKWSVV